MRQKSEWEKTTEDDHARCVGSLMYRVVIVIIAQLMRCSFFNRVVVTDSTVGDVTITTVDIDITSDALLLRF